MCKAHFIHRRCTSYAEHTSLARRANFIEKVLMQSIRTFSGGGGRICLHFHSCGMKIAVLTPSSRCQATVHRTVAFGIFESIHPFFHHKKTAILTDSGFSWWGRTDSNHRSETQQIYSLSPLATRELPQICGCVVKTCVL